ncbi:hypothetical protein [Kitasatospora sp. NPDC093102]|uniref:hypothetical protein n=1 Tax=Kitasatospora sp. NPDC093102 TaxID=3155069 RepID=UPI003442CB42
MRGPVQPHRLLHRPRSHHQLAPVRLTGAPLAITVAAATKVETQPEPKYAAEFKRDARTYSYKAFDGGHGMWPDSATPAKTLVPAPDNTHEGRYTFNEQAKIWYKADWPFGEYKHFYRIPAWNNALVDGDDLTWK